MRKLAVVAFLVLVAAAGLSAADLHLTTSIDGMGSAQGWYLTPAVAFTWQPELFGVGGEVKVPVGLTWGDTYLTAMALLKIGWVDFGAGISTRVLKPSSTEALIYTDAPVLFTGRIGLTAPLWAIGPGKLGLNASADFLYTTMRPISLEPPTDPGQMFVYYLFVYPLIQVVGASFNSIKLSVGLNYTLDL